MEGAGFSFFLLTKQALRGRANGNSSRRIARATLDPYIYI